MDDDREAPLAAPTDQQAQEARLVLERLLHQDNEVPTEERSIERLARLYHRLGCLNLQLGGLQQAIRYLSKALEGRKVVEPLPVEDIWETASLLIKALKQNQEFENARIYQEWLKRKIPPRSKRRQTSTSLGSASVKSFQADSTLELPIAFDWAREHGFDVDGVIGFRFEEWDSKKQTSPLHLAVEEENSNIVRIMADHVVSLDRGPEVGRATPLLLAASTRDRETVSILLDRGARVDVRDRAGKTALHRCQTRSGGVQVAELILQKWPELINDVDNAGKTALYMAIEMTNEKMVYALLRRDADPNKCFLPQGNWATSVLCTPLIAAIDATASKSATNIRIVEDLLSAGADPKQRAGDGRDAFSAVQNAGLASGELKNLLKAYQGRAPRKPSTMSTSSTLTKTSSIASGSTARSRTVFFDRDRNNSTISKEYHKMGV